MIIYNHNIRSKAHKSTQKDMTDRWVEVDIENNEQYHLLPGACYRFRSNIKLYRHYAFLSDAVHLSKKKLNKGRNLICIKDSPQQCLRCSLSINANMCEHSLEVHN